MPPLCDLQRRAAIAGMLEGFRDADWGPFNVAVQLPDGEQQKVTIPAAVIRRIWQLQIDHLISGLLPGPDEVGPGN
jgi:hypothetical protein